MVCSEPQEGQLQLGVHVHILANGPGVSHRRRSQGGGTQGAPSFHAKINDFNINDMLLILYNIRKKPS